MNRFAFYLLLSMAVFSVAQSQIPRKISYQGALTTGAGTPADDGSYSLSISIYDNESGGVALFNEPFSDVAVSRGMFKVNLGSTVALNLPFNRTYYVELTVNSGPGVTTPVTFPRSEFTSTPYSFRADTSQYSAAAQPTGTAGGDLTGTYPNPSVKDGAISAAKISAAGAASGQVLVFDGSRVAWESSPGGSASFHIPYVDSCTTDSAALMLFNKGRGWGALISLTDPSGYGAAFDGRSSGYGPAVSGTASGQGTAVQGVVVGSGASGAGAFDIQNTGSTHDAVNVNNSGHGKGLSSTTWQEGDALYGYATNAATGTTVHGMNSGYGEAGKFEITNVANSSTVLDASTAGSGTAARLRITSSTNPNPAIDAQTAGYGTAAQLRITNSSNSSPVVDAQTAGSGIAVLGKSTGNFYAGWFEVNNPSADHPALLARTNGSGPAAIIQGTSEGINVQCNSTVDHPQITLWENDADYSRLSFANNTNANYWTIAGLTNATDGNSRLNFYYSNGGDFMTITGAGNIGIGTSTPTARLDVNGHAAVSVLEVKGGSDVAEPFGTDAIEGIEPGTLVSIDEQHPGRLTVSNGEYDPKVAGIVSGAGGINPGITLQQDKVMEGNVMVAIAGRVYCKADANSAPIHPGDLLVSSPNPGHVMKACDRNRSYGAVIGKAMSWLETGTGLVLVLVNLQ